MSTKFVSSLVDISEKIQEDYLKDSYLNSLFYTQVLEMLLKMLLELTVQSLKKNIKDQPYEYKPETFHNDTIGKLIHKLKTFYPEKEFPKLHSCIKTANSSRNEFVHSLFKIQIGKHQFLNYSEDRLNHPDSIKKMKKWREVFLKTSEEILKITLKYQGIKIHSSKL